MQMCEMSLEANYRKFHPLTSCCSEPTLQALANPLASLSLIRTGSCGPAWRVDRIVINNMTHFQTLIVYIHAIDVYILSASSTGVPATP